jgi:hypothetical protein
LGIPTCSIFIYLQNPFRFLQPVHLLETTSLEESPTEMFVELRRPEKSIDCLRGVGETKLL